MSTLTPTPTIEFIKFLKGKPAVFLLCLIISMAFFNPDSHAQCPLQSIEGPSGSVGNDTSTALISNCVRSGENALLLNIDSGNSYAIGYSGMSSSVHITIYDDQDTLVAGAFGDTTVTFTANSSGTYRSATTDFGGSCTSNDTSCYTVTASCLTCPDFICETPANTYIDTITLVSASLRWDSVPAAVEYIVTGNAVGQLVGTFTTSVSTNSFEFVNLNPGVSYWWSVRTVCDSSGSQLSEFTVNDTFMTPVPFVCLIPDGKFTDSISATGARLNWSPVPGAVAYNIIGNEIGNSQGQFNLFSSDTALYLTGLTPGLSYIWSIRTFCDSSGTDVSDFSGNLTFTTLDCAIPDSLNTMDITENSAVLSWGSVPGAVVYNVIGNLVGDSTSQVNVFTSDTSFTLVSLVADTAYWWSVRTICDSSGMPFSEFADNDTFQTLPPPVCQVPANLQTDSATLTSIIVEWDSVPGAIAYNVVGNALGDTAALIDATITATSLKLTLLQPDTSYWWSVRSICDLMGDVSDFAENDTFSTLPIPPCPVPTNLTVDSLDFESAAISWDSIPGAIGYTVIGNAVGAVVGQFTISVANSSVVLTGLNPEVSYWWSVRSVCNLQLGNFSDYATNDTFTTASPPACPTPENLIADSITTTSAFLTWDTVGDAIGYKVVGNVVGSNTFLIDVLTSAIGIEVNGLNPGTDYWWSVKAICDVQGDDSPFAINDTFTTNPLPVCPVPQNLVLDTVTPNTAVFSWNAVPEATSYNIIGNAVGAITGQFSIAVTDTAYTLTGLNPEVSYWWSVRSICDSIGNTSNFAVNDTFTTTPLFTCNIPQNLTADNITTTTVTFNWDTVPGAIGYRVRANVVGQDTFLINVTPTQNTFVLSNLIPDTSYWWSVRAICDLVGDASDFAVNDTFSTLPLPPCPVPTNLTVDSLDFESAAISWDSIPGAIGYTVIGNAVGATVGQFTISVATNNVVLSGLNPEVSYWWSVRSVCNLQLGNFSDYAANDTFTTNPLPTCPVPQNLVLDTVTPTTAVFSWNAVPEATSYNIIGNAVGAATGQFSIAVTDTVYTLTGLNPEVSYWWSVRSICDSIGNTSNFAVNDTFTTPAIFTCNIPQNLSADNITTTTVTFNWDTVPGALGYRVVANVVGQSTFLINVTPTVNTFSLSGLSPDTEYWWSVRAICDLVGDASNFAENDTFRTLAMPVCQIPQNLSADSITTTTVTFNWDTVPGALGYRVVANVVGQNTFLINVTPTVNTFSLSGLSPDTEYWWSVRAICDLVGNVSNYAENDTFRTLAIPVCQIPQNRFADGVTFASAALNWDTVPGAIGYRVQLGIAGNPAVILDQVTTNNFLPLNGLTPDTSYFWSVRSICNLSGNSSPFSANDTFTTLPDPGCVSPQGLDASNIMSTSAVLSWDPVPGALGYRLIGNIVGSTDTLVNVFQPSTMFTLSGLNPETAYWWTVRAICDLNGDVSPFAVNDTFTTTPVVVCEAPQGVISAGLTTSAATLSWDSVQGALNYNVQLFEMDSASTVTDTNTSALSIAIGGLNAGTTYTWTVRSICDSNATLVSLPSQTDTFTTLPLILGCTDPTALNFDSTATVDDSSCIFPIFGCTDPMALNYDSTATVDDSSCIFPIFGCTDPMALNYDSTATVDDSSCIFGIPGCTDPMALNFDSSATIDDSSCIAPIAGGKDFQQTSATLILDGDTVALTGSTIIRRSDAFLNDSDRVEIPLEMESMCLEGSHPVYGKVRINAGNKFGLQSSAGSITQMNPGSSLTPVMSQIELYPEIEIENMSRACSSAGFVLNGSVTEVPICNGTYTVDTPFAILTDCCAGDTLTQEITGFSIDLNCNVPAPVVNSVTQTSVIAIIDSSFNTGVVRLDLVKNGDCDAVIFSSGDVTVGNEQMAAATAQALANALIQESLINPDCAVEASALGNTVTITSDFPFDVAYCLKGSDQAAGVILADTTVINLGQKFSQSASTPDTMQDFACVCEPSNDVCSGAIELNCGDAISGSTSDATATDNPSGCGVDQTTPGVWYRIDGTGDSIIASLCGSSFDTYIAIFEEISQDSLKCFSFNDNSCGLQSQIGWLSQSNKVYKVFVTGIAGSTGDFDLQISCAGSLCEPPALIWSDNISNTTVTLHWTAVSGILGYQIQGNALGGVPLVININDPAQTIFEVRNLPAGLTYEWRIRSICDGGSSTYSDYTNFNNFQTLAACPKAGPISTTINSATSVTLNWTPVNQALAYRIAGGVVGGSAITITVPGTGVGNLTVNNLTPGLSYGWTVRTLCYSNQSLNVTPIALFSLPSAALKSDPEGGHDVFRTAENAIAELTLFPNPTTGLVAIDLTGQQDLESLEILLVDLGGKTLRLENYDQDAAGNLILDLSHLDNGMYTLVVQTPERKSMGKVVVAK